MGKYLSVVLGVATIAFGVWGIVATWPLLWQAILAVVPAMFVLGGGLAVIIGVSEIQDSLTAKQTTPKPASNPATTKS